MKILVFVFFVSFVLSFLMIKFANYIELLHDETNGVQKFHRNPTPRVGGFAIFIAFSVGVFLSDLIDWKIIFCSLPVFLGGLFEDIFKSTSPKIRLIFSFLSAYLIITFINIYVNRLDLLYIDSLFHYKLVAYLFTIFAFTGVVNSINIIDGFNGLASAVCIIIFVGFFAVGYKLSDIVMIKISLIAISAILGFFVWNYPFGKIFLGDGGAYFLGFLIAFLSIYTVYTHKQVSAWFPLLLSIYPIFETIFSIYRRKFLKKSNAMSPDACHLHTLIFKRVVPQLFSVKRNNVSGNSATSPFLWLLTGFSFFPAVIYWNDTTMLVVFSFLFVIVYVILYRTIVRFKIPKWLRS